MIDKSKLLLIKNNAIVVNIARGKIIKEKELIEILEKRPNKFMGIILDVFENEPLDEEAKLWDFENVIITPHNSFFSKSNEIRLWELIMHNINEILKVNK